ncbi:hypothetical protein H072_2900 [Dactylellina haptotyla CBS 200.50]|uniref:Integral membrane protein TmpA n=1 Tax=Dactylellina haptotyla (strain CBS 200.50) TaxID=1284197 RepID=S8AJC6_DACHA|nr:hypothetical protein H072_2900 [Dactylellina haptotyla CBS 200.50]
MAEFPSYLNNDKSELPSYNHGYDMSRAHEVLDYEHRRYRATSIFSRNPVLSYDIEKGGELYAGPFPQRGSSMWPKVRYTFLSAYRRLFSLIFLGNLAGLLYICFTFNDGNRTANLSTAVSANLLVAVLIRQDFIVNALFSIFATTPQWFPLRIRRAIAKIYEYGGVHTGAAVGATMWYIFLTEEITRTYVTAYRNGVRLQHMVAVLTLTWIPMVLLLLIVIFAIPALRRRFHDHFEASHRFGGWLSIAVIWAQAVVLTDATRGLKLLGIALAQSPSFWFLLVITICIIVPWLRLRKVVVRPQRLSNHATRLWFDTVKIGFCQGFAVSDSPLFEWHTFASLPEPGYNSCSLLVSNAGDWTKQQINQGPHKLWIRGIPRTGVLRIAPIFKCAIMIATGSGIGPQLSFLMGCGQSLRYRLLWSTRSPLETYGEEIMSLVHKVDPEAVVIDTKKTGRPDIVQIAYELYVKMEAEAVFVISNQKITRETVYALESRGIPAYGPVFDS